jgi:hypothetical protein
VVLGLRVLGELMMLVVWGFVPGRYRERGERDNRHEQDREFRNPSAHRFTPEMLNRLLYGTDNTEILAFPSFGVKKKF